MRLARTVFSTFSLSQGIRQGLWADLNRSESIEPPRPPRTLSHQNLSFHQKVMRPAGFCVAKRSAIPEGGEGVIIAVTAAAEAASHVRRRAPSPGHPLAARQRQQIKP